MSTPIIACRMTTSPVELELVKIWCRALGREDLGAHDDFFELGGDSLAAAQMMGEIERAFGKHLPLTVLHEAPTITDLAVVIEQENESLASPSLVPLQPLGSAPPFFCVHGAGGSVLGLMDLARLLAPHQPFYGIQTPSCDSDATELKTIEEMARNYVAAVRAFQREGPYFLGGYSFGGSVALEMAQQLRIDGQQVALLAILDHTPPPTRYRRVVWTPTLPFEFLVNTARWLAEDIWRCGPGQRIAALGRKGRTAIQQIRNWASRRQVACGQTDVANLFPDRDFPTSFRQLLESHYQAMRDYVPRPYASRVVLFRSHVRPLLRMHGHDLGWSRLASGGLEIVIVPGNHETMLKPPNVQVLARELRKRLSSYAPADSAGA